jgi:hypothetical protein
MSGKGKGKKRKVKPAAAAGDDGTDATAAKRANASANASANGGGGGGGGAASASAGDADVKGVAPRARLPALPPLRTSDYSESAPLRVVIIHGDPTKPNPILPGGKWDDDDFAAVRDMEDALKTVKDVTYRILCDHDHLYNDLRQLRQDGKVDLVLQFCDEVRDCSARNATHTARSLAPVADPAVCCCCWLAAGLQQQPQTGAARDGHAGDAGRALHRHGHALAGLLVQ